MGTEKRYDGYESFQYLDAGTDYEPFEHEAEMHSFGEPYEVPLEDQEEERARRLSRDSIVISLHEHPIRWCPKDPSELLDYCREGRIETAYDYLSRSNLDAVFDNHLAGMARRHSKSGWKWADVVYDIGMRASDLAHQEFVIRCDSVEDVGRAHREGRVALVPAIENAEPIENELDRIDVLYGLGVRLLGITYTTSNTLGTTASVRREADGGLTTFGEAAVGRMNELGMVVDPSHASDRTTLDVCEASDDPVVLSHNGAQALNGVDRLDPDEVLAAVADTGGVVGIQAAPQNMATRDHPRHSIHSVMDHFEYVVDLVGIDHVTFGLDSMYGDHVGFQDYYFGRDHLDDYPDWMDLDVDYVEGLENPTEGWHNIVRWLVKEGYSDEEIRKVVGENTLRVLDAVW